MKLNYDQQRSNGPSGSGTPSGQQERRFDATAPAVRNRDTGLSHGRPTEANHNSPRDSYRGRSNDMPPRDPQYGRSHDMPQRGAHQERPNDMQSRGPRQERPYNSDFTQVKPYDRGQGRPNNMPARPHPQEGYNGFPAGQYQGGQYHGGPYRGGQYYGDQNFGNAPQYRGAFGNLITDRGMIKLFFLSLLTLGIYGIWFWSRFVKDLNVACRFDGKNTQGVIVLMLLSFITLGIYYIAWKLMIVSRVSNGAAYYGKESKISIVSYILWNTLGAIIFGVFIAEAKLFKTMNNICMAYNYSY